MDVVDSGFVALAGSWTGEKFSVASLAEPLTFACFPPLTRQHRNNALITTPPPCRWPYPPSSRASPFIPSTLQSSHSIGWISDPFVFVTFDAFLRVSRKTQTPCKLLQVLILLLRRHGVAVTAPMIMTPSV
jgi:hypothetical protein